MKKFNHTTLLKTGGGVPPQLLWAVPGGVFATWFIWGALTDDIKESLGFRYDPDAVVNRVEAEKIERLAARSAAKAASKPPKVVDDEEEEAGDDDDDDDVTAESISAAVAKAVEASGGDDDDEEDSEGEEEEEEEEEPKPKKKKKKVKVEELSSTELWDHIASTFIEPGEDEEDDDDDDDVSSCSSTLTFGTLVQRNRW